MATQDTAVDRIIRDNQGMKGKTHWIRLCVKEGYFETSIYPQTFESIPDTQSRMLGVPDIALLLFVRHSYAFIHESLEEVFDLEVEIFVSVTNTAGCCSAMRSSPVC